MTAEGILYLEINRRKMEYITTEQLKELLKISRQTIYNLEKAKALHPKRLNGMRKKYYKLDEVKKLIK